MGYLTEQFAIRNDARRLANAALTQFAIADVFIGFLLSALVTVPLIINLTVDPFTFPGNLILSGIAAFIFGVILTSSQWLILRQTEMTPRVFALINTVIGILVYFLLRANASCQQDLFIINKLKT